LGLILSLGLGGIEVRGSQRLSALAIAAAAVGLPLLQLIPLPPRLWETLPGRDGIMAVYIATGLPPPWLAISLDPHATLGATLSLLPALSVFLATTQLEWRSRRTVSLIFIAVGVASVFLGLAQLMGGPSSPLRFFPITNPGDSVGLFANRNHYAALLYCSLAFALAWLIGLLADQRRDQALAAATLGFICVLFAVGIVMARSRAGVFLMALVVAIAILMANRIGPRASRRIAVVIGTVLGFAGIIAGTYGLPGLLGRFDDGVIDRFRLVIATTTARAAETFLPFGSGFGTFVPVYQRVETTANLSTAYINHAHNDWLESWLEGGWPAAAIIVGFVGWFLVATIKVWKSTDLSPIDQAVGRAATVAIGSLLIHSAVDYPLRTTAMMVLFGFCCGLLIPPPDRPVVDSNHGRLIGGTRRLRTRLGFLRHRQSGWQIDQRG
jgi:O-antigen ligase